MSLQAALNATLASSLALPSGTLLNFYADGRVLVSADGGATTTATITILQQAISFVVGSGLHRVTAGFSMSKRFKLFDPYFGMRYTLGVPQGYPTLAPERDWRDSAFWTNVAGIQGGVEIAPLYAFPDLEKTVNFRFLLGFVADYVARHRGPSEMSDALRKWTMVDHHLSLLGRAGVVFSVPFVTLRALAEVGHETPHFLTGEVAGRDTNDNGIEQKELNVHYNAVLDTPGRRVKVTETLVANGMITLAVVF